MTAVAVDVAHADRQAHVSFKIHYTK
jgi:hypothetical protein